MLKKKMEMPFQFFETKKEIREISLSFAVIERLKIVYVKKLRVLTFNTNEYVTQ
jgi:hypothetical protein